MHSGVCDAGLTTLVHPAAIAGPSLRVPIAIGKFQGVIMSAGPTGCFITITRLVPLANCFQLPSIRSASPEYQRKKSAA